MESAEHDRDQRRSSPRDYIIAALTILVMLGLIGGALWTTLGPPISVSTQSCKVIEEPNISHSRRSIHHTMETSCGKLSFPAERYWSYSTSIEAGKSYSFTIEHRLFSSRAVDLQGE